MRSEIPFFDVICISERHGLVHLCIHSAVSRMHLVLVFLPCLLFHLTEGV